MFALIIILALLGWLVGSGINHAANILPTRQTLFQQPSCFNCGLPQGRSQWSALVSLLTNRRGCTNCGASPSKFTRALLVELITPLLFGFLGWWYGLTPYLGLVLIYTAVLILVTVTDLEHRLIFNIVILPAILLAIGAAFVTPGMTWRAGMVGGVAAFIMVYIAVLVSRGGLGEGDVTLFTLSGFIIGFSHIFLSLTFGVFLGGFVAFALLVTRRVTLKTFIPYGPFLTTTGWIMLIWGEEIWRYYFW